MHRVSNFSKSVDLVLSMALLLQMLEMEIMFAKEHLEFVSAKIEDY